MEPSYNLIQSIVKSSSTDFSKHAHGVLEGSNIEITTCTIELLNYIM